MRRWLVLWICVALLVSALAYDAPISTARDLRPPEALTVRWLEPGWVLVRWKQMGDADYVVIYSCIEPDQCTVVGALEGAIQGTRTATAWGAPGHSIKIGEFHTTNTPHVYAIYGWSDAVQLPSYPTLLPAIQN
jgi:hypothetical protein